MRTLVLLMVVLVSACSPPRAATQMPDTAEATEVTEATEAPFYAPDFTLQAMDGETITLSDLRGKWVVVNFWATYCVPCVTEMPVLEQIAAAHPEALVVLAINLREERETVQAFLAEHDLALTVLLQPDDATLINYQVIGLPQTLLITPAGEIDYRQFGPVDLATFGTYIESRVSSSS